MITSSLQDANTTAHLSLAAAAPHSVTVVEPSPPSGAMDSQTPATGAPPVVGDCDADKGPDSVPDVIQRDSPVRPKLYSSQHTGPLYYRHSCYSIAVTNHSTRDSPVVMRRCHASTPPKGAGPYPLVSNVYRFPRLESLSQPRKYSQPRWYSRRRWRS